MIDFKLIKNSLNKHFGIDELSLTATPKSGGDIHQSFVLSLTTPDKEIAALIPDQLFAKVNSNFGSKVLASEFESLQIISAICPNLFPQAVLFDEIESYAVLIMPLHDISPINTKNAADAGRVLALMHKNGSDGFGWQSENYIGLTPQSNQLNKSWVEFYREQRLQPITQLASERGLENQIMERLNIVITQLDKLLNHYVTPSFVHGDLWSGNLGFDNNSQQPLFYDPAPYYGDREVDIAMTELFGRQPESFYSAYEQEWPLAKDYKQRRPVYNLYHALNHVVLFGLSYTTLVEDCLNQIEHLNHF